MSSFGESMHCNACMTKARPSDVVLHARPPHCGCKCTLCSLALEVEGAQRRIENAVDTWTKAVRAGAR